MSKKIKDLNKNIMDKIHQEEIKMKPKIYFIIAATISFIGLLSAIVITILSVSMIMFLLKAKGPGADFRFNLMLENFPVWLIVLSIFSLITGILLFKKYNFSFKFDIRITLLVFIFAVIVASWLINSFGFNEIFMKRGPLRDSMQKYLETDDFKRQIPGTRSGKNFRN